jgi:Carboxypeptidase regulatory-like domain
VAGSYTMAVSARAYRPAALVVHVPDTGKIHQDVELVGGARLHGTIRTKLGRRPLPDARVTLIDSTGRVLNVASAGPDGGYRFVDVPEGEYTLVATAQPPAACTLRIAGGEDHEHDMELSFPD